MNAGVTNETSSMLARADHLARSLNHTNIGTEHMLYAYLVREDGPYRLDSNLTAGKVVDAILEHNGCGASEDPERPQMTPRLEAILRQLDDGDDRVTPKMVIDAILANGVGYACQFVEIILHKDAAQLREQLAQLP